MRKKLEQVEAALRTASYILEHAARGEGLETGSRYEEEHETYVAVNAALVAMRDLKHQQDEITAIADLLDDDDAGNDALRAACVNLCDGCYRND